MFLLLGFRFIWTVLGISVGVLLINLFLQVSVLCFGFNVFVFWPDLLPFISDLTGCWLAVLSVTTGAVANLSVNTRK